METQQVVQRAKPWCFKLLPWPSRSSHFVCLALHARPRGKHSSWRACRTSLELNILSRSHVAAAAGPYLVRQLQNVSPTWRRSTPCKVCRWASFPFLLYFLKDRLRRLGTDMTLIFHWVLVVWCLCCDSLVDLPRFDIFICGPQGSSFSFGSQKMNSEQPKHFSSYFSFLIFLHIVLQCSL